MGQGIVAPVFVQEEHMKDGNELNPAQQVASRRAVLVARIGEYCGSASNEWWCGCFITNIKQKQPKFEAIADKALATGEYSSAHLYRVSHSTVSWFLVGERKEASGNTYYELAGFNKCAFEDVYQKAKERPETNFVPRFLGRDAGAFMLAGFIIGFLMTQVTHNFWYPVAFPSAVLVVYLIMRIYDRDRYARRTQSLALDLMKPVNA